MNTQTVIDELDREVYEEVDSLLYGDSSDLWKYLNTNITLEVDHGISYESFTAILNSIESSLK